MEPYIGRHVQQLSFVYAKDVAFIAVHSLFSAYSGTYNLSDGNCYSRYDLANHLKKLMGSKTFRFHLPESIVRAMAVTLERVSLSKMPALNKEKVNELSAVNWACDIGKAKKELGFKPAYDLETGLRESLNWYQKYHWL